MCVTGNLRFGQHVRNWRRQIREVSTGVVAAWRSLNHVAPPLPVPGQGHVIAAPRDRRDGKRVRDSVCVVRSNIQQAIEPGVRRSVRESDT